MSDAPLDAFRHQFLRPVARLQIEFVLEVAIAAAAAHRAERSHAAIFLEASALEQNDFAGTLVGAGKEAPDHGATATHSQGFRDVP